MGDISKRIVHARQKRGMTQDQLADAVGVSRNQISKWEVGRDNPGADRIVPMAHALDVSIKWLLTGEEETLDDVHEALARLGGALEAGKSIGDALKRLGDVLQAEKNRRERPKNITPINATEISEMHTLPVIGKIAADHMPTFDKSQEVEMVDVKFSKQNHYCLQVKGRSMHPTISEGDVCIVERVNYRLDALLEETGPADRRFWLKLDGEIVAASVDGNEPVLKRMAVSNSKATGFKIWLLSDNPRAPRIEVNGESRLYVCGIVRRSMRDPKKFEV